MSNPKSQIDYEALKNASAEELFASLDSVIKTLAARAAQNILVREEEAGNKNIDVNAVLVEAAVATGRVLVERAKSLLQHCADYPG